MIVAVKATAGATGETGVASPGVVSACNSCGTHILILDDYARYNC